MAEIGIGLIGCGGRLRAVVGQLLKNREENIKVICAYDPSEAMLNQTREMFNPDLKVYDSYEEMVRNPDINWVMVGSWNCFHREHTVAAFKAGKNVFCEKPLATNLEDCVAMREAWLESGKKFNIGFTLRYSPHYNKIKELIDEGKIGYLVSMEFNETLDFNHGGGILGNWRRLVRNAGTHLLEKCSHDIDLVNWIVGSKARRVASFGGLNFFTPENEYHIERVGKDENGRKAYRACPGTINPFTSDKDIIDNQVAIIEFENNVRATFHTNCNAGQNERRMYIIGSEGSIRADVIAGDIELKRIGFNEETQKFETGGKGGHGGGDSILGDGLAACILEDTPPRTSLDDGFRSAVTCFGIDQAMETGTVVDMAPLWKAAGME